MNKKPVIFISGLNTRSQNNQIKFGPIIAGTYEMHLEKEFRKDARNLYAIKGVGQGRLEDQAAHAAREIINIFGKKPTDLPVQFHLLGHSMGGLVCRIIPFLTEIINPESYQIKTVTTIASPHRGEILAKALAELKTNQTYLYYLLKLFRYDTEKKREHFAEIFPENLQTFDKKYPLISNLQWASVVSGTDKLPVLFKGLSIWRNHMLGRKEISDGMVALTSQPFGEILHQAELDHLATLGFNWAFSLSKRKHNRAEFIKLTRKLLDFYEKSDSISNK